MEEALQIRDVNSSHVWSFENGFYWFSDIRRMGKLIAQYELYKKITDLAGDIYELGVYKGASLIRFATFRELLEANHSRRIVAFDAFGPFPRESVSNALDVKFIDGFESAGGEGLDVEEVKAILNRKGLLNNIELVKGDVRATIAPFLLERPASRIALLHLDMDVYEPTKFALQELWDRVVPGGIVAIDDYNAVEGATRAVDEFVLSKKISKVEKLCCSHVPAFIVKKI